MICHRCYKPIEAPEEGLLVDDNNFHADCVLDDYASVSPLEWAEYEFATIEHDWSIPARAADAIRAIFKRLAERR